MAPERAIMANSFHVYHGETLLRKTMPSFMTTEEEVQTLSQLTSEKNGPKMGEQAKKAGQGLESMRNNE